MRKKTSFKRISTSFYATSAFVEYQISDLLPKFYSNTVSYSQIFVN